MHSRFSTNTFPSWPLAHPFRRIAHNGEINTVTGNENWMRAREALIRHRRVSVPAPTSTRLFPICTPGASDTARFDEALELLHLGAAAACPHAVLMMIPEAWERHPSMDPDAAGVLRVPRVADGAVGRPGVDDASPTGRSIGAVLDRNGLRPSRIWVTEDGLVVMASEAGVLDLDPSKRGASGSCGCSPAGCSWSTPTEGRIVSDEEIKAELAAEQPYQAVARQRGLIHAGLSCPRATTSGCWNTGLCCGNWCSAITYEELNMLVAPMARSWRRSRSARWEPIRRSPCSHQRPRMLYDYFQQLFAQVTNPPLDAIREEVVTSVQGTVGPEGDLLNPNCGFLPPNHPVRSRYCVTHELAKLINLDPDVEDQRASQAWLCASKP